MTIRENRARIKRRLYKSPSLSPILPEIANDAYEYGRFDASRDTGKRFEDFPQVLPWSIEEVLKDDFSPAAKL